MDRHTDRLNIAHDDWCRLISTVYSTHFESVVRLRFITESHARTHTHTLENNLPFALSIQPTYLLSMSLSLAAQ